MSGDVVLWALPLFPASFHSLALQPALAPQLCSAVVWLEGCAGIAQEGGSRQDEGMSGPGTDNGMLPSVLRGVQARQRGRGGQEQQHAGLKIAHSHTCGAVWGILPQVHRLEFQALQAEDTQGEWPCLLSSLGFL